MSDDNNTPVVETPEPKAPTPQPEPRKAEGKVWTDEYVQGLREEAKSNRLGKKASEAKLKKLIGLKDDEDIDDAKIDKWQADREKEFNDAITKANEKLILAEIKSLEGYNSKLVERLLDKSKVTIADDGTVTGLKEAVEELVTEFPEIKVEATSTGANPPQGKTEPEQDEAAYNEAVKSGNTALAIAIKNKIFANKK